MRVRNARWKKLLEMSLVGIFAVTPLIMGASVAQADPPDHAPAWGYRDKDHKKNKDNKKDKKDKDYDDYQTMTGQVGSVRGQQFDLRVGNATYNVYASSRLPNGLKQGDTVRLYGQRSGNNDIRNANVSVIGNNNSGRWNNNGNKNRWNKNKDSSNNYQTMTGQVSNVKGQQFDLRVENTTYNVYASTRLPNGLRQGDTVRVYGQRSGNNHIRNANISVIGNNNSGRWDKNDNKKGSNKNDKQNRWNNNKDSSNNYQTFAGQASNVKGQQFDLRVENTTYNVYASSRLPNGLKQGGTVRVYGQRSGNNDIRNANVSVIGNNNSGRWNNNGNKNRWNKNKDSSNNFQTMTGQASKVKDQKFDLRVGNTTYNVYASSRLPNGLKQGETVRVYGERSGNNDIRNANVVIVRNR